MKYSTEQISNKIEEATRFLKDSENEDEFYVRCGLRAGDLHGCRACLAAAYNMIGANKG